MGNRATGGFWICDLRFVIGDLRFCLSLVTRHWSLPFRFAIPERLSGFGILNFESRNCRSGRGVGLQKLVASGKRCVVDGLRFGCRWRAAWRSAPWGALLSGYFLQPIAFCLRGAGRRGARRLSCGSCRLAATGLSQFVPDN